MKVHAKKKFGQNFISDKNLINKIINILPNNPNSLIVEIGPGKGALTKELANKFKKVIAIEIDWEMEEILKSEVTNNNLEIVIADILDIDFKEFINKKNKERLPVFIISNLPYYITSEILFKTLKASDLLECAIFMMQKEVATRLCANSGENNYNNLSIACEFFAKRKYEFTVKKQMFNPIPKVDSAVVSLFFNDHFTKVVNNQENFLQFLRKIFNNRRKTILNNLTNITNNKELAAKILDQENILKTHRPEVVNIDKFIKIYQNLEKNNLF